MSTASSSVIISDNVGDIDAYFASVEVKDPNTNETNFVEIYATHDGTNTFISEFFTDSEESFTNNFIGNFTSGITTDVFSLNYENDELNEINVRSSIIGIGTTAAGISTYRFKSTGQIDNTEKTFVDILMFVSKLIKSNLESSVNISSSVCSVLGISNTNWGISQ